MGFPYFAKVGVSVATSRGDFRPTHLRAAGSNAVSQAQSTLWLNYGMEIIFIDIEMKYELEL